MSSPSGLASYGEALNDLLFVLSVKAAPGCSLELSLDVLRQRLEWKFALSTVLRLDGEFCCCDHRLLGQPGRSEVVGVQRASTHQEYSTRARRRGLNYNTRYHAALLPRE